MWKRKMPYRQSSKFHKIRHTVVKQQGDYDPSANHFITLTKEAAEKFSGCKLYEIVTNEGILLVKSGGDMFQKSKVCFGII